MARTKGELVAAMVEAESLQIGQRARKIRRRRGLALDVVAGLAGISKGYLSMLETGQRRFERRGLIEDIATALGCSITDLTGQPYLPVDRDTAEATAALPGIRLALHDYGPEDVPDLRPRPLDELLTWANTADQHRDQARLSWASHDLGSLLTELQVHLLTIKAADRDRVLTAYLRACVVASDVARRAGGNIDLAVAATQRGYEVAQRHNNPGLIAFASWIWALQLMYLAARTRAARILTGGIDEISRSVHLNSTDSLAAEMLGMMHLVSGWTAARDGSGDDAHAHLDEAAGIATRLGERNGMRMHFGPTNVAVWRLGAGIELGDGGLAYAQAIRAPLDMTALGSSERSAALHLYLARALAQDGPDRDTEALRHLDAADRLAPTCTRNDPLARDLVTELDRRARHQVWELDSLCHRFTIR